MGKKTRRTVKRSKKNQKGGVAPVSYTIPPTQRQPSEQIMEWATTAGASAPSGQQMKNVAYGGTRRKRNKTKRSRRNRSRRN